MKIAMSNNPQVACLGGNGSVQKGSRLSIAEA